MFKTFTLCLLWLALTHTATAQYAITLKKARQPTIDISGYKQIGIGDIVGPLGGRTAHAMNLADEITVRLMEKGTPEILDRAALALMANSKTTSADAVIGEGNIASLSKRMQSALLIVGRIQNEKVYQEQKSNDYYKDNCKTQWYYEASGDFTMQLRLLNVKTAKLLRAEVITIPMKGRTESFCQPSHGKLDEDILVQEAIAKAALQISRMLYGYEETLVQTFETPMLINPFKELKNVVAFYNNGDHAQSLTILEKYVGDPNIKEKHRPMAFYNYGVGLYADNQFAKAKDQFLKAYALSPTMPKYKQMADQMDREGRTSPSPSSVTKR